LLDDAGDTRRVWRAALVQEALHGPAGSGRKPVFSGIPLNVVPNRLLETPAFICEIEQIGEVLVPLGTFASPLKGKGLLKNKQADLRNANRAREPLLACPFIEVETKRVFEKQVQKTKLLSDDAVHPKRGIHPGTVPGNSESRVRCLR